MGDFASGTKKDLSNAELETAYQESQIGNVGRVNAKLSFEAELQILRYSFASLYADNTDVNINDIGVFVRVLEDFYREAEKLQKTCFNCGRTVNKPKLAICDICFDLVRGDLCQAHLT